MLMQKLVYVAQTGATTVLYILMALSVYSIGIVIERWWYFRKRRIDHESVGNTLEKKLRAGDLKGAKAGLAELRSVETEVIKDALDYYADGPESLQEIVQKGIRLRRKQFEGGLLFLGTLGSNAPFIGLFGTVLGVVSAFKELGAASANAAAAGGGMGNVMSGISEALIATAVGILVAIPAVVAYNLFQKRCTDLEENTGILANHVLAVMKSESGVQAKVKKGRDHAIATDEPPASQTKLRTAEANS